MHCRQLDQDEFDQALAAFEDAPLAAPEAVSSFVFYRLGFKATDWEGALLGIRSRRLRAFLYKGPLVDAVRVPVDQALEEDGPWDNVELLLLHPASLRRLISSNDRDFSYWTPNATIEITPLEAPVIDEDDLLKTHDVVVTPLGEG